MPNKNKKKFRKFLSKNRKVIYLLLVALLLITICVRNPELSTIVHATLIYIAFVFFVSIVERNGAIALEKLKSYPFNR